MKKASYLFFILFHLLSSFLIVKAQTFPLIEKAVGIGPERITREISNNTNTTYDIYIDLIDPNGNKVFADFTAGIPLSKGGSFMPSFENDPSLPTKKVLPNTKYTILYKVWVNQKSNSSPDFTKEVTVTTDPDPNQPRPQTQTFPFTLDREDATDDSIFGGFLNSTTDTYDLRIELFDTRNNLVSAKFYSAVAPRGGRTFQFDNNPPSSKINPNTTYVLLYTAIKNGIKDTISRSILTQKSNVLEVRPKLEYSPGPNRIAYAVENPVDNQYAYIVTITFTGPTQIAAIPKFTLTPGNSYGPKTLNNLKKGTYTFSVSIENATTKLQYNDTYTINISDTGGQGNSGTLQTGSGSGTLQTGSGSGTLQTGSGSGTLQTGSGSGTKELTGLDDPLGSSTTIDGLISKILDLIVTIGTPLVAFFFIFTGFKYVSAQGNEGKLESAKRSLVGVVVGAICILGAYTMAEAIKGSVKELRNNDEQALLTHKTYL